MIYDVLGNALNNAYGKDGLELSEAYDVDGAEVFSGGIAIMSYNMQWFRDINGYASLIDSLLQKYNPLIIGSQEYRSGTYGIGTISGVEPATYFGRKSYSNIYESTGLDNGNAIISKTIADGNVPTVEYSRNSYTGTKYGYQKTYFTVNGKRIAFINTHLTTSDYEADKVAQAEELFNAVQNEEYFIITGDFNTVCKSVNDTEYTTIMKQFVDAGYNVANCSEQFGFKDTWTSGSTESGTWYPCDHIITSANISMNSVVVDTSKIAIAETTGQSIDHLPIIAYLTI